MPKKRKIVVFGETEQGKRKRETRVEKSTDEMAERLPPPERVRYETTKRILNRFMTEYLYDESQSMKFVDNIMKKYPFDSEKEQEFIHEEIEKYYEEEDKKLPPTPSPPAPAPPIATAPTPTPAPPTDASSQLTQALKDLRNELELTEDDPDAQLKAKHSKKRKKRKSKRKVSKRKKKKTKRR